MSDARIVSVACAAMVSLTVAVLGAVAVSGALEWLSRHDGGGLGEMADMVVSLAVGLPLIVAVWWSFLRTYNKIEDALDRRALEGAARRKRGPQ